MSKSDADLDASGAAADQFEVDVMILGEAIAERLHQLNEMTLAMAVANAIAKMEAPGLYGEAILTIVRDSTDPHIVELRGQLRQLLDRGMQA